MIEKSFASFCGHMSLWEVAHRWAGYHPDQTDTQYLPVELNDILNAMMRAQVDSQLQVARESGHVLKDWTYIASWEDYHPSEKQMWDGTNEHQRELYIQQMTRVVAPHDRFIDKHWGIISGEQPIDMKYLKTIYVDRNNLGNWALNESLPFPDFWFSPDEKTELINEQKNKLLIRAKFGEFDSKGGVAPSNELYEEARSTYVNSTDEELAEVLFKPGRVKSSDIDEFWKRLSDSQKSRLLCRSVASTLWRKNENLTIREITDHPMILEHCGGSYYSGKDTIRNWIKDLDPRPEDQKTGRPSSK